MIPTGVRKALSRWLWIVAVPALSLAQADGPQAWPSDAGRFRIHMIGNAHIDPVWLWPWAEGFSVVQSTFRSALERMNETPGFAFTASSAQFYDWVSKNDPALLARIRQRVAEGRWDPVGGWWVEPDVNMPSGEALMRQGLYGQLTFHRLLGRYATVAYNPDSFGHPRSLPQILKAQGMNNYVFMRPKPEEKTLPGRLFWWESGDGTRVLAYRIPFEYGEDRSVRKRVWDIASEMEQDPMKARMAFYGAGDHGGGATKENLRSIGEVQTEPGAPKIFFSTPTRYFAEVRKEPLGGLPVVKDDLQHHSVGCYTAESEIKKSNRSSETALGDAEKLAAIGSVAWGADYPKTDFTEAWKKVLFLQFHDSLAGTALPEHYATTAREGYGYAMSVAHSALYEAAQKLAWQIPAEDPESQYLVAFNLQPRPVTKNVEYDLEWPGNSPGVIEDEQGKPLVHQWTRATTEVRERKRLVVQVELPAFGYRQIRIRKGGAPTRSEYRVHAEGRSVENEHLRLTFDADGSMSLFDKDAGRQVFTEPAREGGARAIVYDDPSDTWSHDVRAYDKQIGSFGNAGVEVMEDGPLRARLRVRTSYGSSTLQTDWLLYAGSRTVEAQVSLDWHEHLRMVKFSYPVSVPGPRTTYEIAYGNIVRDSNGDENPGQRWIDISGDAPKGDYGFAVINDAKYGYSSLGNDLQVSIVRGAAFANHKPQVLDPKLDHLWQDQGVQTFRMLLVPHSHGWREAALPVKTEEFLSQPPIIYQGIHPGTLAQAGSFLAIDATNVIVSAIKKSEVGNDLIVRCYETNGEQTTANIDLRYSKRHWSGVFKPYEIKTLRISEGAESVKEVNALEN